MRSDLRDHAKALKPVPVQEYLRTRDWTPADEPHGHTALVVYRRGAVEVEVPLRPELADYSKRMVEALEVIAATEHSTVAVLLDELTQPVGDTLAVRLASASTSLGTVPLLDALRVREAAKNMILAAAHSAISPQAYFPRMSRRDAVELLESVREGQTQRGSFVSRFIVPVAPTIGPQEGFDPFGRRVVRLLMQALDEIRRVRSLGGYEELLSREKRGVSGNLLAALAALSPAVGGGVLDVSVRWSRNRAAPGDAVSRVSFPEESLRGLDAVAEAMRSRAHTKGFEIIGYVTRLDREPPQPAADGDVVIVPSEDASGLGRVHVHLDAESYKEAVKAHGDGSVVRVVGTLSKAGRRWSLADASGFEIVPTDVDETLPTGEPE